MIAFVSGKRVAVDPASRTVTVQGKIHADQYPFSDVHGRVKLYRTLDAKHPVKRFYAALLAATLRAADMVAEIEGASDAQSQ